MPLLDLLLSHKTWLRLGFRMGFRVRWINSASEYMEWRMHRRDIFRTFTPHDYNVNQIFEKPCIHQIAQSSTPRTNFDFNTCLKSSGAKGVSEKVSRSKSIKKVYKAFFVQPKGGQTSSQIFWNYADTMNSISVFIRLRLIFAILFQELCAVKTFLQKARKHYSDSVTIKERRFTASKGKKGCLF